MQSSQIGGTCAGYLEAGSAAIEGTEYAEPAAIENVRVP
jgi:hypothetical protein